MKIKSLLACGLALTASISLASGATPQENWSKLCAKCHGEDGKGKTKMGERLNVRDYTSAAEQAKFTDDQAFKAIKEGVKAEGKTKMPAYSDQLSDDDIKALVKYVRDFKKSE